jgi:hypothetical protein
MKMAWGPGPGATLDFLEHGNYTESEANAEEGGGSGDKGKAEFAGCVGESEEVFSHAVPGSWFNGHIQR